MIFEKDEFEFLLLYLLQEGLGFNFTLLDIGGGFPGDSKAEISFEEVDLVSYILPLVLSSHFVIHISSPRLLEAIFVWVFPAFTLQPFLISVCTSQTVSEPQQKAGFLKIYAVALFAINNPS